MIDLFELKPEKFYSLKQNELFKEKKINDCLDSNNYVASIKKDGNYARFVKLDNQSKIQTRGISKKTNTYGEVQEKVPHITNFLVENVPNNSLLVGELYYHGGSDHEVGSILRCLPPKAVKRQENNPLIFYIFDVWYWNGRNLMIESKEERVKVLKEIEFYFKSLGAPAYFEFAEYTDKCRELMEYAFDNNEEGIVLTLKNSIVNPGTRTAWKTLKIKKELQNDADVFLTGNYKLPEKEYTGKEIENWEYWMNEKTNEMVFGKHYKDYINGATLVPVKKTFFMGWPASVEMGVIDTDTGLVVSVGWLSGLSDEIKEDFIRNIPKYTNKPLKINAMETTEDFKFRHAKFIDFRDDISIDDCTFQKIFNKE